MTMTKRMHAMPAALMLDIWPHTQPHLGVPLFVPWLSSRSAMPRETRRIINEPFTMEPFTMEPFR